MGPCRALGPLGSLAVVAPDGLVPSGLVPAHRPPEGSLEPPGRGQGPLQGTCSFRHPASPCPVSASWSSGPLFLQH